MPIIRQGTTGAQELDEQLDHLSAYLTDKHYQQIIDDRLMYEVQQELNSYCAHRPDMPRLVAKRDIVNAAVVIAFAD